MVDKYSIFYSYKEIGDVLLIIFDEETLPTSHNRREDVAVIYHDDTIIGYNIFNISKVIKIKTKGIIYFPSDVFIDVINTILQNQKLETLTHCAHSGYVIGQVTNIEMSGESIAPFIDVGDKIVKGQDVPNVKIGDKIVVALPGARLYDGQEIKEDISPAHLCSNRELSISNDDQIYLVDEDGIVGEDFFKIGEENHD